jgi:hypothetical protein
MKSPACIVILKQIEVANIIIDVLQCHSMFFIEEMVSMKTFEATEPRVPID